MDSSCPNRSHLFARKCPQKAHEFPTLRTIDVQLNAREVATRLGVCRATVYELVARGALANVRILGAIRVQATEVDAFITSGGTPREAPRMTIDNEAEETS